MKTPKQRERYYTKFPHSFGVQKRYSNCRMKDFPKSYKKYIEPLPEGNGFYLHGKKGVGKTHLLNAIMANFLIEGIEPNCYMVQIKTLLDEIKETFSSDSEETEKSIQTFYSGVPILFVDDIGAEKITEWSTGVLYGIVNSRYNDMLPTYFTSNLSPKELPRLIGERIASRILSVSFPIKLTGRNRRF